MTRPRTRYTQPRARSRLFQIDAVGLVFSNGEEAEFERLSPASGGAAVLVVAITDDGEVLMIHEYAVGTDRYELGLPKGRLEAGECPIHGARRELREETGYDATRMDELRRVTLAPGYISHETAIILARGLHHAPLPGDEPEPLEVSAWPWARLDDLLKRDVLSEARSIAALYLARSFLNATQGD